MSTTRNPLRPRPEKKGMVSQKVVFSSLAVSVAVAVAAIIYIIVDKTTYCRVGYYRSNSAVSDDLTVICMPGYTFSDGNNNVTHQITCDKPPYWNWDGVPECFPINEALGWKCPIEPSNESDLTGQIVFTQANPRESIRMKGQLTGLRSDLIQKINVENTTASCYLTKDPVGSLSQQEVLVIENFTLTVDGILNSSRIVLDETFQFHFRIIGSEHVQQRQGSFNGVAVFVVEQNDKTIGVYSSLS